MGNKNSLLGDEESEKTMLDYLLNEANRETMDRFIRMQQIYDAGIKEIRTKLEILDAEFKIKYDHNPIHHIESRLKKPKSIIKKAKNKSLYINEDDIMKNIHDIAGIRVICNYIDDVYVVSALLMKQDDIRVVKVKDYIKEPKDNGYRSLHLVLEIPIFLAEEVRPVHVEVQLRTIAMDFWASLEHKLRYKTNNQVPKHVQEELLKCAQAISELDENMQGIHNQLD